jgi:hypothetical protein
MAGKYIGNCEYGSFPYGGNYIGDFEYAGAPAIGGSGPTAGRIIKLYARVGGAWKEIAKAWAKVLGTWTETGVSAKISGGW